MLDTTFIPRVIAWNEARYSRQSNTDLTQNLLAEEIDELNMAENEVEYLDAIGDICFVAVGALWKMGVDEEQLVRLFAEFPLPPTTSLCLLYPQEASDTMITHSGMMFSIIIQDAQLMQTIVAAIFLVAIPALHSSGRIHQFGDIMAAICTSNESKLTPKEKTDPRIKVNAGPTGKGPNYVAPTAALQAIVNIPPILENTHG